METFKTRARIIREKLNEYQNSQEFVSFPMGKRASLRRQFLKDIREGEYLIRISKRNRFYYYGSDCMYMNYTYLHEGYSSCGPRRDAQWFTGQEAFEFISKFKGFSVVKK